MPAYTSILSDLSPKLKTRYRNENQFWNPGFTNGVRQFCGYQYFCYDVLFYLVSSYSPFFSNLFNQDLHKCIDPKNETREFRSTILFQISGSALHRGVKVPSFTRLCRKLCFKQFKVDPIILES